MEKINASEAMTEVISEVLEKFAYMFVDPAQLADIRPEGADFLVARMGFSGEWSGYFRLLLPRDACQVITANILGFEEGDEFVKDHLDDGIKELLNIIGAHVLTKVAGDRVPFQIAIPETEPADAGLWSRVTGGGEAVAVMGDSRPVVFQMVRS